jgi:hypothetical protein
VLGALLVAGLALVIVLALILRAMFRRIRRKRRLAIA